MDCESRMGGTTMIIECKKRAEGYKPVKENELELIEHLLNQNFYKSYSITGSKIKVEGRTCRVISFEIVEENWRSTSFNNEEDVFFKCGKDGQIHIIKDKYNFKNYIAVPFDMSDKDVLKIFSDPNFVSFERKHIVAPSLKKWGLKTTTKSFTVRYGDILIFDENWEIVDCLMNDPIKLPLNVLTSHNYIVK